MPCSTLAPSGRRVALSIFCILSAAFFLRVGLRLSRGEADFWTSGYVFYYDIASNIASGKGILSDSRRVFRVPGYPVFLALTTIGGKSYLLIVLLQAAIGTGTTLCAFLIARRFYGPACGVIACLLTAIYPYYVVHDTAMQETSLFTFLTALAIVLILQAGRNGSPRVCAVGGLTLAAAVLTRLTILPFAVVAPVWVIWRVSAKHRSRALAAFLLPLCLPVGLWLARSSVLVGRPILTSEAGIQLWTGNNPYALKGYPASSVDQSFDTAIESLTPGERAELDGLASDEVAQSDWFTRNAVAFIREHPALTMWNAFRKLLAAFSWKLNPAQGAFKEVVYFLGYFPMAALGVIGMYLGRRDWKEHSLIYALFATFTAVTAVYFGHTSHRSYLDIYWIVFSASVIVRWIPAGLVASFEPACHDDPAVSRLP